MGDPQSIKEEGNQHFKNGKYEEALQCYTSALELGSLKDADKAIIYKNRSACNLKLNNHEAAIKDATASLDLVPNDPKALFRRCQAYDILGDVHNAFKDAVTLMKVDPKNTAVRPIFQRLNPLVQERAKKQNSLTSKVSQMLNLAFDLNVPKEKRIQAFNNLIVLTRENAGGDLICHEGGLQRLTLLLKEKDADFVVAAVRVLACLTKSSKKRAETIVRAVDMTQLILLLGQGSPEVSRAVEHLFQMLFNVYCGLSDYQAAITHYEQERKKGERLKYPELKLNDDHQRFVDQVFSMLVKMFENAKVTAEGRDCAMELVMKNVTLKKGLGWTPKFLDTDGIEGLLTVAGAQKQFKSIPVTDQSRMHASVTLSTIYEDLVNDKQRDKFKDKCANFLKDMFGDGIFESKIEAVEMISALLQGPYEVGSMILNIEGIMTIIFTLANSENTHYQKVAVEAIVNSASKKDKCSGILKDAVPILKKLYQSADDSIKVRALVGLCKLGSYAGDDASLQPMADGSTLKLSRICRKFLCNTTKDCDLRKWATEGLAYLTLDAEVKEELANDTDALKSIFDLAKNSDHNMIYACVTVLVNVTNSYDKQDIMPEMIELAKFAKQHVPEEHPKDKHEFVVQRIQKLTRAGVTNALVALSSAESKNSREQIARVFIAIATEESLRGLMVQQGSVKALLHLTENNTDVGTVLASHALAKIAVTMDPNIAFPGQRVYEVVRPFISLLHKDRSGLQNFEALLALTNLASVSESVRKRILVDHGLQSIEQYMFEEHEMIRRAATQCMSNMMISEKVQEMCEGDNDRVKIMVLFAGEEDQDLVRAAAGALAIMSANKKLCKKIVKVKSWLKILQMILVNDKVEIQYCAAYLTMNLMASSKRIAGQLVESQVLEILMALTRLEGDEKQGVRESAQSALDTAVKLELIKPSNNEPSAGTIYRRDPALTPVQELKRESDDSGEDETDATAKLDTRKDNAEECKNLAENESQAKPSPITMEKEITPISKENQLENAHQLEENVDVKEEETVLGSKEDKIENEDKTGKNCDVHMEETVPKDIVKKLVSVVEDDNTGKTLDTVDEKLTVSDEASGLIEKENVQPTQEQSEVTSSCSENHKSDETGD